MLDNVEPLLIVMASVQRKNKKYDFNFKLSVVKYAEEHSGEAAARHFSVDPKRVRDWRKIKSELQRLSKHNSQRARLPGGGRKKKHSEADVGTRARARQRCVLKKEQEEYTTVTIGQDFACAEMTTLPPSPLSTHVLNTGLGVPGAGMVLSLHRLDQETDTFSLLTTGATNEDGRCPGLITREAFIPGVYKMRFETGQYWTGLGEACFYPYVEIVFTITDPSQRFHVPLLLSRFSYSTYRGS